MLTNAKINLKIYSIYSTALLSISYFVVRSLEEYFIVILVFLAACANQWMLIIATRHMSEVAVGIRLKNSRIVSLMNIGKIVLVVGALSFGVQIMGKRILIPLLIYVLQIVVLYLSFEKKPSAEKGI